MPPIRGRPWHQHEVRMSLKRLGVCAVALAAACGTATTAWTADLSRGRKIATKCQACHGMNGLSRQPNAPNLAGQNAMYLEAQLRAFRSGARSDPQMTLIARGLAEDEIAEVVAWYAAIRIDVRLPDTSPNR